MSVLSNGDGLLKGILARPSELLPKLIYADWLEENDQQARAEFVRDGPEYRHFRQHHGRWSFTRYLRSESKAAVAYGGISLKHRSLALQILPIRIRSRLMHYRVRNGFVFEIHCNMADFVNVAPVLFATQPLVSVLIFDRYPRPRTAGANDRYPYGGTGEDWARDWDEESGATELNRYSSQSTLPKVIFDRLSRTSFPPFEYTGWVTNLSDACVSWGREFAGVKVLSP